jgi:hypothetical protein
MTRNLLEVINTDLIIDFRLGQSLGGLALVQAHPRIMDPYSMPKVTTASLHLHLP